MAKWLPDVRLVFCVIPAVIVGVVYEAFLGHRHDYTGHYAAGYGGTLGAMMVALKALPERRYERSASLTIGLCCVACILLGVVTEATIFRIAKFDEIDFFNQSLGAVLAAIVSTAYADTVKPTNAAFDAGLVTAIVFLSLGGCFAVA